MGLFLQHAMEDDKPGMRKGTIQLAEAVCRLAIQGALQGGGRGNELRPLVDSITMSCADVSVTVRKQAMTSIHLMLQRANGVVGHGDPLDGSQGGGAGEEDGGARLGGHAEVHAEVVS